MAERQGSDLVLRALRSTAVVTNGGGRSCLAIVNEARLTWAVVAMGMDSRQTSPISRCAVWFLDLHSACLSLSTPSANCGMALV